MKKFTLLLPLALGSCGLFGTPKNYAVSGTISGTQPSGTVKLAFVGVSTNGVVNSSTPQIAINTSSNTKFSVDYPNVSSLGAYQVIAYIDTNNNNQFDLTETRTKNNNKYLVYSPNDGVLESLAGLKKGWNYYTTGSTPTQPTRITDYDLSW